MNINIMKLLISGADYDIVVMLCCEITSKGHYHSNTDINLVVIGKLCGLLILIGISFNHHITKAESCTLIVIKHYLM